jgi:hypothetical protein
LQGVRGRQRMHARQAEDLVQGVWGRQHMHARQAEEPVQGVWGRQPMRARQAEGYVQGVRGYQGWLRGAAALGSAACNGSQEPLRLESSRNTRACRRWIPAADSAT